METHIKFASDLGIALARAKFAAENPKAEERLGVWAKLPPEKKAVLLGLSNPGWTASRHEQTPN